MTPCSPLKASAVLMWIVALLRERSLPIFMGLSPMYGGGFFERWSPEIFAVLLGAFAALAAFELFAGVLVWHGEQVGALITLAFWAGFAVPIPPLTAVVRVALLLAGWSALR
jgi:hypothetical protein